MPTPVSFLSTGIRIAAHVYAPDTPNGRTLVIGHPGTSIKEQSPALYAGKLRENGFTVLTFDAAFQGESGGSPRGLENPAQRIEDFKAAVSYLNIRPDVDPARIGLLGICASGGYVIPAAAGDRRVKAVATVAAVDVGQQIRVGPDGKQDPAVLDALLQGAAQARTAAARGDLIGSVPIFPATEEEAQAGGLHVWEGWNYYCTSRCDHPRSAKSLTWDSIDRMVTFDAFRFIGLIAPRPLLMITAENAVTAWMTHDALALAAAPKALHEVPGATHVDLYDKEDAVGDAVAALTKFFDQTL